MNDRYPIQVKQKDKVGRPDIDSFEAVMAREDRHTSTQVYIDCMRPHRVELARVLKKTGSLYCHCDWRAVLPLH